MTTNEQTHVKIDLNNLPKNKSNTMANLNIAWLGNQDKELILEAYKMAIGVAERLNYEIVVLKDANTGLHEEVAEAEAKIKKLEDENTELKQALEMENEARHQEQIEQQIEEYVNTPPHWSDKY